MVDRGHNKPPEMIDLAKDVTRQINHWFTLNPEVGCEEEAREIKLQIDRAKLCLKDLEDERDGKVRPLNEQVSAINASYKGVRTRLEGLMTNMVLSIDRFIKAEEARRVKAAELARQIAQEAEARAREAERLEQEAIESELLGELENEVDVQALTQQADEIFAGFEAARRQAIRAEEQTHVKIHGGIGRALSQREKEVLDVEDPILFLKEVGLTDNVKQAMLTAARAYKRFHGMYPKGIKVTKEKYTV